jgi:hypothetical protein
MILIFSLLCCFFYHSAAQRVYKQNSVLSAGNWYKIEVEAQGVYKIDVSFLFSLGLASPLPSGQLRLFGRRQYILSEANNSYYSDDLEELAIQVIDGGDGIMNGSDYALFFSAGPHQWLADTAKRSFIHKNNLYSDKAFYFLTIGGTGKRITIQNSSPQPFLSVSSFDEHIVHELDSVNFLSSGKEWFGEELSTQPGRSLSKSFVLTAPLPVPATSFTLVSSLVARAVNSSSRFDVLLNNKNIDQIVIPSVGTGVYDPFAQQAEKSSSGVLEGPDISIMYNYVPGGINAQGWIDKFNLFYRRQLIIQNAQISFRDWSSAGNGAVEFRLGGAGQSTQVWDVSDPVAPVVMKTVLNGSEVRFSNEAFTLKEYISFGTQFFTPVFSGKITPQDLHNCVENDYFIITHPSFLSHAQNLAKFHQQKNNLRTVVVTTEQIFNEFSGGIPDPTAIKDFIKMYYDKYKANWKNSGKYLLLFGKGSFDYKNRLTNNTSFVPVYESVSSLDPLSTYTSDDFFGFLDGNEDINSNLLINQLDIGIGRVPVKNADEAKNFVDKVIAYHTPPGLGPWRNHINFIADDEDYNLHLQDAEVLTSTVASVAPVFNSYKIYLDAFRQESNAAGGRYPAANEAINNNILNGTLIWNYSGHGGPFRLAEEVVLDQQIVNKWNNADKLPLLITATCDFAPYDNPRLNSLGEQILLRPKTGAIALMTTTRVVFAYSNRIMNNNYLQTALLPDSNKRFKTLGEAVMAAKNFTYTTGGDITNNRKFSLLGDPAMTLGFPRLKIKPILVNGRNIAAQQDTLSATEMINIEGEVTDNNENRITDFNGIVFLTLFDKPQTITTLGNDATSLPVSFQSQTEALFKGKVSATNGKFSFRFRLPKDLNYQYGRGKMSLYGHDGLSDGNGFSNEVSIGGIASDSVRDNEGPAIKAYLNDERFVNGSITNSNPVLIVKLSDSSGINTGTSGIDHNIAATLDNDNNKYYELNDYYETDLDSYQQGTLRFQLPELSPGHHTLKIKAWDVLNNSSEYILEFTVVNDEEIIIEHVLNYPNPFTTKTTFWFEHNKPGVELKVSVAIFTITGKIIKTLRQTIITDGNRSMDIEWNGRDEYGDRIARGVYLYRLTVQTPDGKQANKLQRLVMIR